MDIFFLSIAGILILLIAVIAIRTAAFRPRLDVKKTSAVLKGTDDALMQKLAGIFSEMLQCKTISSTEDFGESAEFEKFRSRLCEWFPVFHAHCTLERVGTSGLLYHLPGECAEKPCVLMAHYDVVPVDETFWEHPAFSGYFDGAEIWGRGAVDTKVTLCSALAGAEKLLKAGFTPRNDIYFSFAGDEEVMGPSASAAVVWMEARGIKPAFVLDEGGAVTEQAFPGVTRPCAFIGTAEKGRLDLSITATGAAGHASAPPAQTLLTKLSKAVVRLEKKPFPRQIPPPVKALFNNVGRYSTFVNRMIFANLWCFTPLLDAMARKTGGDINALIRTSCALTMAKGSDSINVLPSSATFSFNLRLIPGDTEESVISHMRRIIKDDSVEIKALPGYMKASPVSPGCGEAWELITQIVSSIWPEALVAPYLMVACTDSRYFCKICDNVYRFSPIKLSAQERERVHGHNERISLDVLADAVLFYEELISKL